MITVGAALAGSLVLEGPGRIERSSRLHDQDTVFSTLEDGTVEGEGWFKVRGLGVPYFVHLGPDEDVRIDLIGRVATGSADPVQQLRGQFAADDLRPQDLRQLKKAVKKLPKLLDGPSQRALDLAAGRLAMVLAEGQRPEIGKYPDWIEQAHAIIGWTDASAQTPSFVDFAVEVGAALRRQHDLETSVERVRSAGVPAERTLVYGVLEASIDCCVHGLASAREVRERASAWPVVASRLDGMQPTTGAEPPPLEGIDAPADLDQGRVLLVFWQPDQPSAFAGVGLLKGAYPDLRVIGVAGGEDESAWRTAVRGLGIEGVEHVLSAAAHDTWYVDGPVGLHTLEDGRFTASGHAGLDSVRSWLETATAGR